MEDPGSLAGIEISPKPALGPLANILTSLAIFIAFIAKASKAPCANTIASRPVSA